MANDVNVFDENKLKEVIRECGNEELSSEVIDSTDLIQTFGYDSICFVRLIVGIEETFLIPVEDEILFSYQDYSIYKNLLELVQSKWRQHHE